MDDVLRYYTGKSYHLYSSSTASGFYGRVDYSLWSLGRPGSVLIRINPSAHPGWSPYKRAHNGHIVCYDGFNWNDNTIRFQDPYNEADYHSGGGATYGHHTYKRVTVWYGSNESTNQMIY